MADDPIATFIARLERALADGSFVRLVLARPRATAGDLLRVSVRAVLLKGEAGLSFVHTHRTRDITKNLSFGDGVQQVRALLDASFGHAHLFTASDEIQLLISKKGRQTLVRGKAGHAAAASRRARPREAPLPRPDRPFLADLGVTDAQHRLMPAMSRKWKQINKFIEVLDHALDSSPLGAGRALRVVDFGSGKGYLTFAMHDYLRNTLGRRRR